MKFDHIGLISNTPKANEIWVEATKVWVTDYHNHPFKVEWLRFEEDSPVTGPVRERPHTAWEVDDIDKASEGMKVLLAPFDSGPAIVGFYENPDGAVIEFIKYKTEPGNN